MIISLSILAIIVGGYIYWKYVYSSPKTTPATTPETTTTPATSTPASGPSCQQLLNIRLPGGSYKVGTMDDGIPPYPYISKDVSDCEAHCLKDPTCKQYVVTPDGKSCYPMNKKYSYDPTADTSPGWTSGYCNV